MEKRVETYSHCSREMPLQWLWHYWDTRAKEIQLKTWDSRSLGSSGHKPLVKTVLYNVGGLWDQFMERYVEQCPMVLILQTKHAFERTGKKG